MKELLDKLSSYNIFNYLFPGVVFVVLLSEITSYDFVQQNFIVGAFLYYFIGLIISRIGSIFIEPILKKAKFVKFSDYSSFVRVSKIASKLDILSEVNNMYRTICSLIFVLIVTLAYERLSQYLSFLKEYKSSILLLFLLVLFLFSYKKQTEYINKRIQANEKDK